MLCVGVATYLVHPSLICCIYYAFSFLHCPTQISPIMTRAHNFHALFIYDGRNLGMEDEITNSLELSLILYKVKDLQITSSNLKQRKDQK